MRKLVVRAEFWDDAADAIRWYQMQEPGLGPRLVHDIKEAIERIEKFPDLPRKLRGPV